METLRISPYTESFIHVHPAIGQIRSFFDERNVPLEEADLFYYFHESTGWKTDSGTPIFDWKTLAKQWIGNLGY
ncbi:hypothetical protein ACFOUP_18355 [Belliella kenyensis]|uniref:Uncharacterized protein n=1 Tax=Belliella kenyensis TaxID=1472724 RepID=A0ABV8ERK9_9BACT|nr:hypothetical protein [Belliella kenyensis]MCH7402257.1 hypothetical protein [Belliella kenyensis]MDN3601773.1 hypothetical protein [Belliella kenyensis]